MLSDSPSRSKELIVSSLFIVAVGIFDIYLLLKLINLFDSFALQLVALITLIEATVVLRLWGHMSVKYLLAEDRLIIYQSLGREEIPLRNIASVHPAKLNLVKHILWGLIPTYTKREGLIVEVKQRGDVFISPRNIEEFHNMLRKRVEFSEGDY
jgi:hypothetical protein